MGGDAAPLEATEVKTRRRRSAIQKPHDDDQIVHNLNGQRLGRKGRYTRQRIINTAIEVLENPADDHVITLSEVARRAPIGMGSLYIYFADLTELMQAVLEPIMASVEDEYVHLIRNIWPDDRLADHALEFVTAYHAFWKKNARPLHMRNNMADRGDDRMMQHRTQAALPVMRLLVSQMGGDPALRGTVEASMATALMTGLERVATVMSGSKLPAMANEPVNPIQYLIGAEARLFELAIRDMRQKSPS